MLRVVTGTFPERKSEAVRDRLHLVYCQVLVDELLGQMNTGNKRLTIVSCEPSGFGCYASVKSKQRAGTGRPPRRHSSPVSLAFCFPVSRGSPLQDAKGSGEL